MVREIKFRAWNKGLKKMHQNVGVHPHLMMSLMFEDDHYNEDTPGNYLFTPNGNNVIIEQYTGLKDVNGVELYEGDIIYSPQHTPDKMEVKFIEGGFCMDWGDAMMPIDINHFYSSVGPKIKVIGNIHENKELLIKNK